MSQGFDKLWSIIDKKRCFYVDEKNLSFCIGIIEELYLPQSKAIFCVQVKSSVKCEKHQTIFIHTREIHFHRCNWTNRKNVRGTEEEMRNDNKSDVFNCSRYLAGISKLNQYVEFLIVQSVSILLQIQMQPK